MNRIRYPTYLQAGESFPKEILAQGGVPDPDYFATKVIFQNKIIYLLFLPMPVGTYRTYFMIIVILVDLTTSSKYFNMNRYR